MRMRWSALILGVFLATQLRAEAAAPGASTARDPFWPLGYAPAAGTNGVVEAHVPVEAPPPVGKVITDKDWEEAELALGIQPVRYSTAVGTEGSAYILLWGRIFSKGSIATSPHKGVEFSWNVADIREGRAVFSRVQATEITVHRPR